jgi:Siphovirus Gp157
MGDIWLGHIHNHAITFYAASMNLTLFDAAQSVRETVSQIDLETGEISDLYTQSRELFDKKAEACVAYALEEGANLKAAKDMLKAMTEQLKAREARRERFLGYMAECMKSAEVTQVSADGLAKATLYIGRDESVVIEDGATFPPELCNDPKPPEPSKTKIKLAIQAGQAIAGAMIVRKDRFTIN